MKNYITTFFCFLICTLSIHQIQAQNNFPFPSKERVETLLEIINNCKNGLEQFNEALELIENNPEDYSYADYQNAKGLKKLAEECIANSRKELDALRKDYPGWFNNPGVMMPLSKGHQVNPRQLDDLLDELANKIAKLLNRFKVIKEPK